MAIKPPSSSRGRADTASPDEEVRESAGFVEAGVEWVRIGVVARPHGLRGGVVITLDNPTSESLFGATYLHLGAPAPTPTRHAIRRTSPGRRGQLIVSLKGVDSPEDVDPLRGREVLLEVGQLPELEEGEFWFRDLLGLEAVDPQGVALGAVREVVDTADVPVLVLGEGSTERFVPFTDPFVVEVDLAGGRIVVEPPEEVEA